MSTGDLIQLIALIVTIGSLIYQQSKTNTEIENQENRIIKKLRIFLELQKQKALNFKKIKENYDTTHSPEVIEDHELKKVLYEMMKEKTISYDSTTDTYIPYNK